MIRNDFELVAMILKKCEPDHSSVARDQWLKTIDTFAKEFSALNPRFKQDVFKRACGVEDATFRRKDSRK